MLVVADLPHSRINTLKQVTILGKILRDESLFPCEPSSGNLCPPRDLISDVHGSYTTEL
jgi:hypothetical protein